MMKDLKDRNEIMGKRKNRYNYNYNYQQQRIALNKSKNLLNALELDKELNYENYSNNFNTNSSNIEMKTVEFIPPPIKSGTIAPSFGMKDVTIITSNKNSDKDENNNKNKNKHFNHKHKNKNNNENINMGKHVKRKTIKRSIVKRTFAKKRKNDKNMNEDSFSVNLDNMNEIKRKATRRIKNKNKIKRR